MYMVVAWSVPGWLVCNGSTLDVLYALCLYKGRSVYST